MNLLKFPEKQKIGDIVSRAEYAALLIPSPRQAYLEEVCAQARQFGFAGVIATPYDCPFVLEQLEGTGIETVCLNALNHALDENFDCRMYGIDVSIKIGVKNFELSVPCGLIRDGKFDVIQDELSAMVEKVHLADGKTSVILEPEFMEREAMKQIITSAEKAGADYIRICSGLEKVCGSNGGRANLNSICFVKQQRSTPIAIKAGGGWDYAYLEDCAEYIDSGAERIDVGPRFVEQLKEIGYRKGDL